MGGSRMTESQVLRFAKSMEDQGVEVTRTKKGLFLRLPNGGSDMVHFTNSDTRAFDNLVARLRRAGVQHPDDPKALTELPAYITDGSVREGSKQKVYEYVRERGIPTEVYSSDICRDLSLDPGSANRFLYHSGFVPGARLAKKRGRPWITPDWLIEERQARQREEHEAMMQPAEPEPEPEPVDASGLGVPPELMDFVHRAHAAQEAVNALGAGKPAATVELDSPLNVSRETSEREFLDTHDSWTLDLRSKPAHLTLADYLSILESAGLGYEIRVWRNR